MNQRTAKLLRRHSRLQHRHYRHAKRLWRTTPRPLRAQLRRNLIDETLRS